MGELQQTDEKDQIQIERLNSFGKQELRKTGKLGYILNMRIIKEIWKLWHTKDNHSDNRL